MATEIEVRVKFFSHEAGGRKRPPLLQGYRPHFVVPPREEMLGVEFAYGPSDYQPNEEVAARVICLYEPSVSYDTLIVGADFEIVEGPKVVGIGIVAAR